MGKYRSFLLRTSIWLILFCLPISAFGADKVTLQLKWFHQFQFAGYYAAKEKGFYAAEGLDVVFRQRDTKTSYIDDVLAGKAQYGTADAGLLFSRLQGKPVVVLAQIFQHSPLVLLTLKESGLRSPYQLAGKKVMIDTIGYNDAPANGMLFKTLGSIDQIQPVQMTFRYEDLTEKKVDAVVAYVTDQPFKFQEAGVEVNILDPRDYGIDFYGDNLFTTEQEIKEHPRRVEKMIRATIKGWQYALEHRDEIVELIYKKYNPQELSREHLLYEAEQMEKMIVPRFVELGTFKPTRFAKIAETYVALGLTNKISVDQEFLYTPNKSLIDLTTEEQAWLDAHPVIKVSNEMDWPPFDFAIGDRPQGFSIDLLNILAERIGIKLKYINGYTWSELVEMFKRNEIDLLHSLVRTSERETFGLFSELVTQSNLYFIIRYDSAEVASIDQLFDKTVAVVKGFSSDKYLDTHYPQVKLYRVSSVEEMLFAVSREKADAALLDNRVARYFIRLKGIENIKVSGWFKEYDQKTNNGLYYMAQKHSPELIGILNKAIRTITVDDIKKLDEKWFGPEELRIERHNISLTMEEKEWLKQNPVIRVHNEKDWPPFNYFEYGTPRGLSIDYMDLVAEILGINVDYITGPSWNEFLGLIKRKELDVMLNIVKTEDRIKYILFTDPYIKNPNSIVSSQEHPYDTIQSLFGKTVAFPKGFFYEEVLTKSFPQIKRLPVENTLASLKAVTFGRADAALGEQAVLRTLINKNLLSGLRISGEVDIGDPDLANLRLGVRDDWPLLHTALMKAMAAVTPEEMAQIRQKWLARVTDKKDRIPLTEAERKWLADHQDIRLGVDPAWPPFEFIDNKDLYAGIGSGFIKAISDRLGTKMTPIPGLTWSQVIEKAKAGEIDVLPAVTRTSERDKYLNFTKPYLSFPVVIATNKKIPFIGSIKDLGGYRVGVVKDYYTEDILRNDHPYLTLVTFPTLEKALQELDAGRIDASIDNMITISQEIARSALETIRISASTEYTFDLSLGVRKDIPELVGILNKALDDISTQEKAAIQSTWMSDVEVKIRFDFKAILAWAIPIGGSILLIMAFVIIWNRKLGREITERKRTEDQLRKLSSATENSPASVLVTDKNGTIEYVNPTFCEVTGYASDEAIGQNPSILKSGDLPESYYQELWDTIIGGKVWRGEFKNKRKNGEDFWESASISPIKNEEGEITHFVAVKEDITEQKKMRESLRERALQLRTIFRNSPIGITYIGKDGTVLDCNDRHAELMGSTRGKIIGMNLREEIRNDNLRAAALDALAGERTVFEGEYTSVSGEKTVAVRSIFNPTEPGASPTEVINTTEDITERKRMEQEIITAKEKAEEANSELAEAKERISFAISAAKMGVWDWDMQTQQTVWDARMFDIYGIPSNESMMYQDWEGLVLPEDTARVNVALRRTVEKKAQSEIEFRIKRPDGDIRHLYAAQRVILNAEGEVRRVVGMNLDITERKQAEELLRQSEQRLRAQKNIESELSNLASTLLKTSDMTEISYQVLEIAKKLTTCKYGYVGTIDPLTGHLICHSMTKDIWSECNIPDKSIVFENYYGLFGWVLQNREPLLTNNPGQDPRSTGTPEGHIPIQSFLSVPTLLNDKLVGQIALANAKDGFKEEDLITVKRLSTIYSFAIQRQKYEQNIVEEKNKAEAATRAKSDFLANMSHEIRTPMNAVIGMSHLAQKTELTPKQKDYLNKIQSSANSLLGIINDILDFSKIEAGKLDMEAVEFNLDDVLENLANLVTVKAQEKEDLEVLFATGQKIPRFLVGDPLRLGQVLINLANNAVKFTESGEIVVSTDLLKQN